METIATSNKKEEKEEKKEECIELKNIMYKTMLLSGNIIKESKSVNDMVNIEKFLEEEKNNNKSEPWSKLDKTVKIKKLLEYAETYKTEKNLSEEEYTSLVVFLKDCLNRKKLIRVKDVIYDKGVGTIKDIPALVFNKPNKHFTLKNIDKRVSTLKSLPPKKDANKRTTPTKTKRLEETILEY
jgi:hypothetical protein